MDSTNIDLMKIFENRDFDDGKFESFYEFNCDKRQRTYTLKRKNIVPPAGKGTEVFVGHLPPDLFENELFPLFSKLGIIYRITLMVNPAGQNRGYAFISYFSEEVAQSAISTLDNSIVRTNVKISVRPSVDKRDLFLGNIPKNKSLEEIKSDLMGLAEGLVRVSLLSDPHNPLNKNRGYAFVEFGSFKQAAKAKQSLISGNLTTLWGRLINVKWAFPKPSFSTEVTQEVGF